jgi:hypothetical protein
MLTEEVSAGRCVVTASHDPRVVSAAGKILALGQGATAVSLRAAVEVPS